MEGTHGISFLAMCCQKLRKLKVRLQPATPTLQLKAIILGLPQQLEGFIFLKTKVSLGALYKHLLLMPKKLRAVIPWLFMTTRMDLPLVEIIPIRRAIQPIKLSPKMEETPGRL